MRYTNEKRCIQSCTNEIQTIESIASPQPSPPHRRGRKVRSVQTKEDVYNRVQTKYNRLSPLSNPKSEKGGLATCTSKIMLRFDLRFSLLCTFFLQHPSIFGQKRINYSKPNWIRSRAHIVINSSAAFTAKRG